MRGNGLRTLVGLALSAGLVPGCTFNANAPGAVDGKGEVGGETVAGDLQPEAGIGEETGDGGMDAATPDAGADALADAGKPCESDEQCDDRDPCTADTCDAATGVCTHVKIPGLCLECLGEGGTFTGDPAENLPCCEGLKAVSMCVPGTGGKCECPSCLCFVCTGCGDGECGLEETYCNCEEDCPSPLPDQCEEMGGVCAPPSPEPEGDPCPPDMDSIGPGPCNGGDVCCLPVEPTECSKAGGVCVPSWRNECPDGMGPADEACGSNKESCCLPVTPCAQMGETVPVMPDAKKCCPGLGKLPIAKVDPATGECIFLDGAAVCASCGNTICDGDWENVCNCPDDCGPIENPCADMGGMCTIPLPDQDGDGCPDFMAPAASAEGCGPMEICCVPSVLPPGECYGPLEPCDPGLYCQYQPGTCDLVGGTGKCIQIPEACDMLYAPVCGCDGKTYGNECAMQAAQVSKDYDGECKCLPAGGQFTDFDTAGKCCPGLKPKSDCLTDNGGCACPNCPCYICIPCGNGTCDKFEHPCNCVEDCMP